jgi:uncharacterized protein (TIGR00725 family)
MTVQRLKIIGVMASNTLGEGQEAFAVSLGELIARLGCDLLTGGGTGAMEAVCKAFTGVADRRGRCIGIIPARVSLRDGVYERKANYPNRYVEVPIYTHVDKSGAEGLLLRSRNHINALTSDAIVILEGSDGTLSEAHLAVRYRKPVIAFLSDPSRMPALDSLPVKKTNRIEDVEAFIQSAVSSGPAPSFSLIEVERPAQLLGPDF